MEDKIEHYIQEITNTVTIAGLNYDVWWLFKERESRQKYTTTMNKYLMFFTTAIHAHFVALIIALYRLYENKDNTINIPQLLQLIEEHHPFSAKNETEINEIYNKAKPLWVKVAILRNCAFAHRANKLSVSDVFKKANVTPDELRDLWEITKQLINKITY